MKATYMKESRFAVPEMDCPSEERLIRLALEDVAGVQAVSCDLGARRVHVTHDADTDLVTARLAGLGLGATHIDTAVIAEAALPEPDAAQAVQERRTLQIVLAINAVMFVAELVMALVAESAGLLSDALDMFADAAVYGLALYAAHRSARAKTRIAHAAGWIEGALALGALAEVVRRFVSGSNPEPPLMMSVAGVALVANVACLWLLSRHRAGGAHMRASVIFSANDVLANLGVIVAGALVAWTGSRYPDLAIGVLIALLVLAGARRILRMR